LSKQTIETFGGVQWIAALALGAVIAVMTLAF
jgi:hypothetical protein